MATTTVNYLPVHEIESWRFTPVQRRGGILQLLPGQGEDGYGDKISTDRMVRVESRWHRVYAICWSNAASHYIIKGGQKLYIRDCDFPTT